MLLKEISKRSVLEYCIIRNMSDYPYVNITDIIELYEYFTSVHLKCTGYNYQISTDIRPQAQHLRAKFSDDKDFRKEVLLSYFWGEVEYICFMRKHHKMASLIDIYTSRILAYI